jgi:hypothetical protein
MKVGANTLRRDAEPIKAKSLTSVKQRGASCADHREMIPGDRGKIGTGWWAQSPYGARFKTHSVRATFTSSSGGSRMSPKCDRGTERPGAIRNRPAPSQWFGPVSSPDRSQSPNGCLAATASQHGTPSLARYNDHYAPSERR